MEFKGTIASVCEYLEIMPMYNQHVQDLMAKIKVTGIESDSRRVTRGSIFYAKRGLHYDPFQHLDEIKAKGAVAILIDSDKDYVEKYTLDSCKGADQIDTEDLFMPKPSQQVEQSAHYSNPYLPSTKSMMARPKDDLPVPPMALGSLLFEPEHEKKFKMRSKSSNTNKLELKSDAKVVAKVDYSPLRSSKEDFTQLSIDPSWKVSTKEEVAEPVIGGGVTYEQLKRSGRTAVIGYLSDKDVAWSGYESKTGSPEAQAISKAHMLRLVLPPNKTVSDLAGFIYGEPSKKLRLVGVTGTNGKSTVTHLIAQMLNLSGHRCAVFGTLGYGFLDDMKKSSNTTLEPITLQQKLAEYVALGADYAVLEVSSIGFCENRVSGLHFYAAGFTNLSRDHLDYHGTMEDYFQSKARFLTMVPNSRLTLNEGSREGAVLGTEHPGHFGVGVERNVVFDQQLSKNYFHLKKVNYHPSSLELYIAAEEIGRKTVKTNLNLLGAFNAENYAVAMGIMMSMGFQCRYLAALAPKLRPVTGRMECFTAPDKPRLIVDYAHTPDGVEQALRAARHHTSGDGRIFAIVGCGGDRDKGKRPLMAMKAAIYADYAIYTADNPRSENIYDILDDMLLGVMAPPVTAPAEPIEPVEEEKNDAPEHTLEHLLENAVESLVDNEEEHIVPEIKAETEAVKEDLDYWRRGELPKGLPEGLSRMRNTLVIPDRRQAIEFAFKQAQPQDCILIAGKGHEDYQILGDTTIHFSDREICCELLGIDVPASNLHQDEPKPVEAVAAAEPQQAESPSEQIEAEPEQDKVSEEQQQALAQVEQATNEMAEQKTQKNEQTAPEADTDAIEQPADATISRGTMADSQKAKSSDNAVSPDKKRTSTVAKNKTARRSPAK